MVAYYTQCDEKERERKERRGTKAQLWGLSQTPKTGIFLASKQF